MRLLVTRPEPDAGAQAERLSAMGHEPRVEPLLRVEFLDPGPLPVESAQGLVITSRNALRALNATGVNDDLRHLPVFAVGPATAALARDLGFGTVHTGDGDARSLAPVIASHGAPGGGALLHLAGDRLAWDLKGALEGEGFEVVQPVCYRTVPALRLSMAAAGEITSGTLDGVILMSPLTAKTWLTLTSLGELARHTRNMIHFCLSQNVAGVLEPHARGRIRIAAKPSEDELLALIAREAANCG